MTTSTDGPPAPAGAPKACRRGQQKTLSGPALLHPETRYDRGERGIGRDELAQEIALADRAVRARDWDAARHILDRILATLDPACRWRR